MQVTAITGHKSLQMLARYMHLRTARLADRLGKAWWHLNLMQAAAITGHKTLQMLKRYTHLRAEDMAKLLR